MASTQTHTKIERLSPLTLHSCQLCLSLNEQVLQDITLHKLPRSDIFRLSQHSQAVTCVSGGSVCVSVCEAKVSSQRPWVRKTHGSHVSPTHPPHPPTPPVLLSRRSILARVMQYHTHARARTHARTHVQAEIITATVTAMRKIKEQSAAYCRVAAGRQAVTARRERDYWDTHAHTISA